MGVFENKIFLSIEDTIADRVWKLVSAKITPLIEQAGKLIEQNLFEEARDIINSFDVTQQLPELEGFLKTKFVQSALFGASQMTEPEQTIFMEQPALIDPLDNAVVQFFTVINFGISRVQLIALKLLRSAEEEALEIPFLDGVIKSFGGHTHARTYAPARPVRITKGEFAALFNQAVDGNMRALVDIGASLTTSRVISYGFLSEASANGIISYEVSEILDDRTCPVCELMNGKVFTVERALARTRQILQLTDPASIKAAAPFPKGTIAGLAELRGMSADDLAAAGFDTPPYHPLCRGIVVEVGREVGSVTREIRPLRPGVTIQRPSGPTTIQPPQVSTGFTVPLEPPAPAFTTASNHFQRFNDPTANVNRVVSTFNDPAIKAKIKKVNSDLADIAGRETTVIHRTADGQWTAQRKALHKRIIREALTPEKIAAATPEAGVAPKYTTLGGRAGSGKSFLSNTIEEGGIGAFDRSKVILLDSDAIKKLLPEFKGWNAAQVHAESSEIMERITKLAKRKRLNIVHDGTMSGMQKTLKRIQRFEDAGYTLEGHYVFVPPQESARRAIFRWINDGDGGLYTGRYVPTEFVLKMTDNEQVWDALVGKFHKWKFYDNQKLGGKPKLMAEGSKPIPEFIPPAPPPVAWNTVSTVEQGVDQLRKVFGSDYLYEAGRRANRRMGASLSEASTVKQMNAIGKELAELQNRFGLNFGNGLQPMNRNPAGKAWGSAKTPMNRRGAEHLGPIDRRMLLRNPFTKKFKNLDSLKTYRNKYDRPWSVWIYETDASKWSTTFRHEMGHSWTTSQTFDKMETALSKLGKPWLEKTGSDGRFIGKDKAIAGGLEWMKANLTEYSGSKVAEAIAETFSRVTASNYVRGSLPKVLEEVVDDMLVYIKLQGKLT